jgi:7-cyano-7-deazaguanine reductase
VRPWNLNEQEVAQSTPLGSETSFPENYSPAVLYPMSRIDHRDALGIRSALPFAGEDLWNAFEFSWLNARGKPQVAVVRVQVPCDSPSIVESKSMKLYLGSYAQTRIDDASQVRAMLAGDLASGFGVEVNVGLFAMADMALPDRSPPGECLDDIDVDVDSYDYAAESLAVLSRGEEVTRETLHTNLFRSVCPVTGQPDWATIVVRYSGRPMDRAALRRYLIGFRRHPAFHEAVVEQIFMDLSQRCGTRDLSVQGCFLRRGGIDISPFRSDFEAPGAPVRLLRQ